MGRLASARDRHLVLLCSIAFLLLGGGFAHAGDASPPQVVSLQIAPPMVDVATRAQTVDVLASVADDLSGVSLVRVRFTSPSQAETAEAEATSPIPWTDVYDLPVTIPQGAEEGIWHISALETWDASGNWRYLTEADLLALGLPTTLIVSRLVNGNEPPVANAGSDQNVPERTVVTLNGANSADPDGTIASYAWSQKAGPAVTLSDPAAQQPTFTAPTVLPAGASLRFELTVTDNGGASASDTVVVNVLNVNQPPVAAAGPDQTVDEGILVTLNGANSSDPDGTIASYAWTQKAGSPTVTLSDATVAQPAFTAPAVGTTGAAVTFELTVTDDGGLSATDTVIVNVSNVAIGNLPPVANAGPDQTVNEGTMVTLNGLNSTDPEGTLTAFAWTQTAGSPSITLSSSAVTQPTFVAPAVDAAGTALTFQLTVTDDGGLSATDTVIVNVSNVANGNLPPVADAGPDVLVNEGTIVFLNGANSGDADGTIASYAWAQTAGSPSVTLSDATIALPTFTAPAVGPTGAALTFQLTVTDDGGLQATDTVIVNVANVAGATFPPVANAGPDQTVDEGTIVTLNGANSSDPDGTIASYAWAQTAGNPTVTLSDATVALPAFTAPAVGTTGAALTFQLTVTDDGGLQATDTVIVNVSNVAGANLPPVANAGPDQSVAEGTTVTLNGANSSDPDGTIASYAWTQAAGSPSVTLSDPTVAQPTFTAPAVGTAGAALTFQLTVTDDGGLSTTDTVIVDVTQVSSNGNVPPVADAGPDQDVLEGDTVTLAGSGTDTDGVIVSYAWRQVGGWAVTFSSADLPNPSFTAPGVGKRGADLIFELTVTDDGGLQATDQVVVQVANDPVRSRGHGGGGGGGGICFIETAERALAEFPMPAGLLLIPLAGLATLPRRTRRGSRRPGGPVSSGSFTSRGRRIV